MIAVERIAIGLTLFLFFFLCSQAFCGYSIDVTVMDADGRQAVLNGEILVEAYDLAGQCVASTGVLRTDSFGERAIKGDDFLLSVPSAGQYRIKATAWKDAEKTERVEATASQPNLWNVGKIGSDALGAYKIIEVQPVDWSDAEESSPPASTRLRHGYLIKKQYRIVATGDVLTHVDERADSDRALVIVPMTKCEEWWKGLVSVGGPKVVEVLLDQAVPNENIKAKLLKNAAATLIFDSASDLDKLVSIQTVGELVQGSIVTLVCKSSAGGIVAELSLYYVPKITVSAIGQTIIQNRARSDDYEASATGNAVLGSSAKGEGSVAILNHGIDLHDVQVFAVGPSPISAQEIAVAASDVIPTIPSGTSREIRWKVDLTKDGRNPRAIYGLKLGYKVAVSHVDVKFEYLESIPYGPHEDENNNEKGLLDVVFCIDTTGSMADDIEAVKKSSTEIIAQLKQHCKENNISLQVGLVTYQDHADAERFKGTPEAEWLKALPLSSQSEVILKNILAIPTPKEAVGGDVEEDAYAAYMCAMDARPDWENKPVQMGWRPGAAKILIPICDAPPHDPDFEKRTEKIVSDRAEELDPVHFYPLLLPKSGGFFDPTARALRRIANATGGEVVRVNNAAALPQALVDTIKLAIRRHRNEVWRKETPPYVLYCAIGAMLATIVLATIGVGIHAARGQGGNKARPLHGE
jgi:hypothetical protein